MWLSAVWTGLVTEPQRWWSSVFIIKLQLLYFYIKVVQIFLTVSNPDSGCMRQWWCTKNHAENQARPVSGQESFQDLGPHDQRMEPKPGSGQLWMWPGTLQFFLWASLVSRLDVLQETRSLTEWTEPAPGWKFGPESSPLFQPDTTCHASEKLFQLSSPKFLSSERQSGNQEVTVRWPGGVRRSEEGGG